MKDRITRLEKAVGQIKAVTCPACNGGAQYRVISQMDGKRTPLHVGRPYDENGQCVRCGTAAVDVLWLFHDATPFVEAA